MRRFGRGSKGRGEQLATALTAPGSPLPGDEEQEIPTDHSVQTRYVEVFGGGPINPQFSANAQSCATFVRRGPFSPGPMQVRPRDGWLVSDGFQTVAPSFSSSWSTSMSFSRTFQGTFDLMRILIRRALPPSFEPNK